MIVEKGKFYKDEDGRIIGPLEINEKNAIWKFVDSSTNRLYNADGKHYSNVANLVEEVSGFDGNSVAVEAVNGPLHYGGADNVYEAIKVIRAWNLGFSLGNTVKYISRAGKKDPTKIIEDLEKAAWYLDEEIRTLKARKNV